MLRCATLCTLFLALSACGSDDGAPASDAGPVDDGASVRPDPSENVDRDVLHYDLQVDLAAKTGSVTIELVGDASPGLTLSVGNLNIEKVHDSFGDLNFLEISNKLHIGVPPGGVSRTFQIDYSFTSHSNFDGWDEDKELTFLWPAFCGNFFPCNPDPADGATFRLSVEGAASTAVFPTEIPAEAPHYMPAIAVGDFTEVELGATDAGTTVKLWYLPGQETDARAGAAHLVEVFDFLEKTYGPYTFGDEVGSVSANWGGGDYGGMEHHPFWHISDGSLTSEEVHAHEAAHGWYGNGVRIACWEDFVLSEGVVTYMAGRALEESGVDIWGDYECELKAICNGAGNTTSLLDTCGEIDLITHDLWSSAPYQKGAYYLREVARVIGVDTVDQALAEFYMDKVGKAARMRELVDLMKSKGSSVQASEIETLTQMWLETEACPIDPQTLCVQE